jgi:hypothetical protein
MGEGAVRAHADADGGGDDQAAQLTWLQKRLAGGGRPATEAAPTECQNASAMDSGAGSNPSATSP